jgi:hypothetical protein
MQKMLRCLHTRRITVTTLNYDLLVEIGRTRRSYGTGTATHALTGTKLSITRPSARQHFLGRTETDVPRLLKLHGSIDTFWVPDQATGATIAAGPRNCRGKRRTWQNWRPTTADARGTVVLIN